MRKDKEGVFADPVRPDGPDGLDEVRVALRAAQERLTTARSPVERQRLRDEVGQLQRLLDGATQKGRGFRRVVAARTDEDRERIRVQRQQRVREMDDKFEKALAASERFAAGDELDPSMTARDFEEAMVAYSERQRQPGETQAQAFHRLVDSDVVKTLWAAHDQARIERQHGALLEKRAARATALRLVKSTEDMIDEHVRAQQRPDESFEAAHRRLADSGDEDYQVLCKHLAKARGEL